MLTRKNLSIINPLEHMAKRSTQNEHPSIMSLLSYTAPIHLCQSVNKKFNKKI